MIAPEYSMMLQTAVQVQGALSATFLDLATRFSQFLLSEVNVLVGTTLTPFRAPREQRQTALENSVWTLCETHERLLRGISGVPALSVLIFLHELDRRRGPREPRTGVTYDRYWTE